MRTRLIGAAVSGGVLALALLPAAGQATRYVEYKLAATGRQTTSWTANGSYPWCSSSTEQVPYEGSGSDSVSLGGGEEVALAPGKPPSLKLELDAGIDRTGTFVRHGSAVKSVPPECAGLAEGDSALPTSGCGHSTESIVALLAPHGAGSELRSADPVGGGPSPCPWLDSLYEYASSLTAFDEHPESKDGLPTLQLTRLVASSGPPYTKTSAQGHAAGTWEVPLEGGALHVTSSTELEATLSPDPLVAPGRSIAGIALGETYSAVKRAAAKYGGVTTSDSGLLSEDRRWWSWALEVRVPGLDQHGNQLVERAWLSMPVAGRRAVPLKHGPPPGSARIAQVSTSGSYEVTASGAGAGMTLTQLRKAEPHGHLYFFGGPIAWLVEGPGRRRTAFMLFRGVVQEVDVGCRQTPGHTRGRPVSESKVC